MAMIETPRPAPFGARSIYRFVRVFEEVVGAYRRWERRQRSSELLGSLTERELDDVGMKRSERMAPRYSMFAARSL
ncbi:DUF1127 domain-containing protein [Halovulum sp. GXIMD14794]